MHKLSLLALLLSSSALAAPATESLTTPAPTATAPEVQDMSDPLAVYSQLGAGITNDGLNLKLGNQYDAGQPNRLAMNIIELKGMLGDTFGWSDRPYRDNSIDSVRLRNFSLNTQTGLGSQLDINYNFDSSYLAEQNASVSYSFIKALPKMGRLQFYPLVGAGANIALNQYVNDDRTKIDAGYTLPGTFMVAGMYSKLELTDKIWFNYNPMWMKTLSGSDFYKQNAFGDDHDDVLQHEVTASYQMTPRLNMRYFINWDNHAGFNDAVHRLEVNYQL
ncbi:hypothetical protein OQ486_11635 [Plesiomonas shigelloides]|uniref:hypothetical protein n=1 Tax=Plesiomonas shigelloides TaxID=703 RepID=UPI00224799E8|nr:hypothetical protein [Plesiomonas shigelloides]MCX2534118.1 hypothetical protein [Plesiomonas shigelloides]